MVELLSPAYSNPSKIGLANCSNRSQQGTLAPAQDMTWRAALQTAFPSSIPDSELDARNLVSLHGSPLLVLDCTRVREQFRDLSRALPGVSLHYAMKAQPHPAVLAALNEEGSHFDVSSSGEIAQLAKLAISPHKVIHTHPIKREEDIRYAIAFGCTAFVVDNVHEIEKFAHLGARVQLVLRVGFPSIDAAVDLSKKFGCPPADALGLMESAERLGLSIHGLSFHVGSQCRSPEAHVQAVEGCLGLIDEATKKGLVAVQLIDIGGGFPAAYSAATPGIQEFCAPIRTALGKLSRTIRIAAEPGRFIVAPAVSGIATVVGTARRGEVLWYYLDDGIFGSFNGKVFDKGAQYRLHAVTREPGPMVRCVLAGPTCDGIDIVQDDGWFPQLAVGDLIVADFMGAYTNVCATEFNSIPRARIIVLNGSEPVGSDVLDA